MFHCGKLDMCCAEAVDGGGAVFRAGKWEESS
jgi:hypothetical protein